MPTKDPRIDDYIVEAPAFAQPILKHLRKLVHQGCPEIVETIKWGSPFFDYQGLLCGMAAFKAKCTFFFWRDIDVSALWKRTNTGGSGMDQFGEIASLADLPKDEILLACIRTALQQRNSGESKIKRARKPGKELPVPDELKKALSSNKKATAAFQGFAPSHRREYIDWINGAKRPETRAKRVETTIVWLTEGKKQNWRYSGQKSAGKP